MRFSDIVFEKHQTALEAEKIRDEHPDDWEKLTVLHKNLGAIQGELVINSDYSISVIQGALFYCDGENDYEVAVIGKNGLTNRFFDDGDEIARYMTPNDIDELILKILETY